jgi:hypothetical protein
MADVIHAHDKRVELPREWTSSTRKDINITVQFKRNMEVTHSRPRCPDFRCSPYRISFQANWNIRRLDEQTERFQANEINMPPSIGHASEDSNPEKIRETQYAQSVIGITN